MIGLGLQVGLRDILVLTACIVVHLAYRYRRKPACPLPPGIPGWPILGNALDIPQEKQHKFFKALGEKLGSKIFHSKAFGQDIIVLNDLRIAQDLLDKRSALYSSRPKTTMLSDIMGIDFIFPFMQYGDKWRNHRRIFQQYFSSKGENMEREKERSIEFVRKQLLPNLLETPENFRDHLLNCVGGLITASTYGIPIKKTKDPMVKYQEHAYGESEGAATPGRYLVDILPVLKYLPEWCPGAGFKAEAKRYRRIIDEVLEVPYEMTLKGMNDGSTSECFVSWGLENQNDQSNEDHGLLIKQIASATYKAGSDTRTASSGTFILAMLLHPEVQKKAQAEIDTVVGHDRLPDFPDRPHLPYLAAIVKEVLRWNPPLPLGIPHLTSAEDIYEGLYIPEGSVIFANSYAMLRDEEYFSDPDEFNPERFMKDGKLRTDVLDPEDVATFGFGRRVCPGAPIALSTLFLITSSILALFDIIPELDAEGKPIRVSPEFGGSTIISQPVPFKCKIIPRKGKAVENLMKEYMGNEYV